MTDRLPAALDWARRGYLIFPLCDPGPDGKRPRIRGWQDRATVDPLQIESWWEEWPDANVGVALRDTDYVLDADGSEQVRWVFEALRPRTLMVATGRGHHFYFRLPATMKLRNRTAVCGVQGLEGKTAGKLVAGPGSVHKSGAVYRCTGPVKVAELPWWLWESIGDRDESVAVAGDSPTDAELSEWDHRLMATAAVGVGAIGAMRARGRLAYTTALQRLRRDLRGDDAWATVFYARAMQVGEHVARGAFSYQEVVEGLWGLFAELDDGRGGDAGRDHVMRSIRRGVLAGARGVTR